MSQYPSVPASPTDGTAVNWILDHTMTHSEDYQTTLPLQTIYELNCMTTGQTTADFKAALMEHISQLPAQPSHLPAICYTKFIDRCFPPDHEYVEFDNALRALDYIRDLEMRRKKELEKAMRYKGENDKKIITLRARASKLDMQYAKVLTGIRRYTLMHELSAPEFNKYNCIALLNTLYPINEAAINHHLTAELLAQQRRALWKYIIAVEKNGASVLKTAYEANGGWAAVSATTSSYCRSAVDVIEKAEQCARPTSFGSFVSDSSVEDLADSRPSTGRRNTTDSCESSVFESDGPIRNSKLDKLVKGLRKLSTKKSFYNADWMSSNEDFKARS
ncbi:hypothetical protein EX30DRAFT_349592 [Ascodesmis nigricans]|uniref:Uncharacterized protein n=1 Tax=Ascodesmis nigricans TaxID=341454 RepID=A0A4S2MUF2_9PEZI|nr:hypothetical protein EX30DRAFT_349592 [Ascodesmis nigricans]